MDSCWNELRKMIIEWTISHVDPQMDYKLVYWLDTSKSETLTRSYRVSRDGHMKKD